MSVNRRDLIRYLEQNGFWLLREGGNHSIYTNGAKTIPVKRHRTLDRITADVPALADGEMIEDGEVRSLFFPKNVVTNILTILHFFLDRLHYSWH